MTQSSSDSGGHRCYRSSKRLGFVLLVIGGAAVIAALPFGYGDGGSRATDTASPVAATLSIGGLALLVIGGSVLAISGVRNRPSRSRDQRR